MTKPRQPSLAAVGEVLRAVDPGLRLLTRRPLAGGASAQLTAIEAGRPDGQVERLVLRQYGTANLRSDSRVAAHEYALLSLLHAADLPVPRPRIADESSLILPVPYLVIDYVDGAALTGPAEVRQPLTAFTGKLAGALTGLHEAAFTLADLPFLADIRDISARAVGTRPSRLDESLRESEVRAALTRCWPPPEVNQPVLLHGDYWPGNTLWRDNQLVCVIDWEDAVLGDPLADVSVARMEICVAFGMAAADAFTQRYSELRPAADMTALRHWDLYAALRHAGRMADWGLSPADLARLQSGHREFVAALLG